MSRMRKAVFPEGTVYLSHLILWRVVFYSADSGEKTLTRRFLSRKAAFRYYFDLCEAIDAARRLRTLRTSLPTGIKEPKR